jgi:predicted AAA+ superfamily ATPase
LIIIIEWQRRVWKSSFIISYLKEKNINLKEVFYFNKEKDKTELIKDNIDLDSFYNEFVKLNWKPKYIIIDEIQNIKGWEIFIRSYSADGEYKIIITGSNSKLLSGELATYLTWRYLPLNMYPLSYKEFLDFKWLEETDKNFLEYLTYGGMPEIVFVNEQNVKENYWSILVNDIILKDVVNRYDIRNVSLLMRLLAYLADNTGFLISITNITNYLKNQFWEEYSKTTIASYLKYFEIPYLINEVSRYDIKWKKILEYTSKYYWTDVWLRNSFGFIFWNDIWKVLENLVFIKLKQMGYNVYVWILNWTEVNFVWEKNGEIIYIQVCYLIATPEVIEREFWNLLKIKDNYRKIVLSMDKVFWNTYQWIEHINIVEWLLKD